MNKKNNTINHCQYASDVSKCNNSVWEKDNSFCIFHSKLVNQKEEEFRLKFEEYLDLIKSEKEKPIYIDGFIFPETVFFKEIQSIVKFRFYNCEFYNDFELRNCEFNFDFGFSKCTFHKNLKIEWSNFNRMFIFYRNVVLGNIDFHINFVNENFLLINSQIKGYALIRYSTFKGQVEIIDMLVEDAWYIFGIDFSSAARTRFRNIDFRNTYFFDSKLTDIDFIGINWKINKNRIIIGDELVLHTKQIPPHYPIKVIDNLKEKGSIVESLYLQLCSNYDKNRLFDISGKFYISAMEMKRQHKNNWISKNLFSWEAWYKYISNYGQSSGRAFCGIIILLLLCTTIIYFDANVSQSNNINNNFGIENSISIIISFFKSVKYNLYCLIHPAEWTINDNISLTSFVTAWERILVIVFGTFFLLALRRRFRRN